MNRTRCFLPSLFVFNAAIDVVADDGADLKATYGVGMRGFLAAIRKLVA